MMESYRCQVYCFDPSISLVDEDRSAYLHFVKIALSGENNERDPATGWKLKTLAALYDMLKARHGPAVIDYVKISIDGGEWDVIPQLLESQMLDKIKQLSIQIHLNATGTVEENRRYVKILRSLEESGMVRFSSHPVQLSSNFKDSFGLNEFSVYELAWFNGKFQSEY